MITTTYQVAARHKEEEENDTTQEDLRIVLWAFGSYNPVDRYKLFQNFPAMLSLKEKSGGRTKPHHQNII